MANSLAGILELDGSRSFVVVVASSRFVSSPSPFSSSSELDSLSFVSLSDNSP